MTSQTIIVQFCSGWACDSVDIPLISTTSTTRLLVVVLVQEHESFRNQFVVIGFTIAAKLVVVRNSTNLVIS
jgi:hypothetical protein